MTTPTLPEFQKQPTVQPFPLNGMMRTLSGLFVLAAPLVSFLLIDVLEPEWQSGRLADYATLFLFPDAALFIILLLVYSVICCLLLLWNPEQNAQRFAVRLGIYGGMLLALHFSAAVSLTLNMPWWMYFFVLLVWLLPLFFTKAIPVGLRKWGHNFTVGVIVSLAVLYLAGAVLTANPFTPAFWILIVFLLGAPFWSFLLAGQLSLWLLKTHEARFTFLRGLSMAAWLASYGFALRYNFVKMYELYSALPTQPPDCYIATAAANGHEHFVGSHAVELKDGRCMKVNVQLQRLKCAELAMMAASPRAHAAVRAVYDSAGKMLASRIRHPFMADAAYILLKPAEWISFFVLKHLIPEVSGIVEKIYHS